MKVIFSKSLFRYVLITFFILGGTGAILSQFISDYIVLFAVLAVVFIFFMLILLHLYDTYIKPIPKAVRTMSELNKGNYGARIYHPTNGEFGKLSQQINLLARNLSELSIHEQLQSEQLATVIDNMESGLALIDEKGYVHLVNRTFLSMFGGKYQDYVGFLYYDVLDEEIIHNTVKNAFLHESNVKAKLFVDRNDDKKHIELVGAPIFNERNMLKGTVLVFYDITELKNLEEMRKDFVANVSHELKTPITSIRGFSETLLDEDMNDQQIHKKFLRIIHEESSRLQYLVEDLLTLSRLEKEEIQLNPTEINVAQLIDGITPVIIQKANRKHIAFTFDIDRVTEFTADLDKIKQILINLLENAVSYTPEHGKVHLQVGEKQGMIVFQIIDTGIGIPKDALPRIFERFYRVDKARSRNTGGTGLGLAIVKHIVEVLGGQINVESELNKGTTFNILLPKE